MDLDDVFADEDTYEGRVAAADRERAGRLGYLLAHHRVWMDPQLRQLVGYMLDEPAWLVDPISLMVIQPDGVVMARMTNVPGPRTALQQYLHGPPPAPVHHVFPYCKVGPTLADLRDMARRAELSADDTEWLLTLPRVQDLRRHEEF